MVLRPILHEAIYGPTAAASLQGLDVLARERVREFVAGFYGALLDYSETDRILKRLTPSRFEALQSKQAQHLLWLLSPDLDAQAHRARARALGRIHSYVGVDMLWLVESYGLYQQAIHALLQEGASPKAPVAQRILDSRLLLDLQAQNLGYQEVDAELSSALAELQHEINLAKSTTDFYQGVVRTLCAVDGIVAAFIGRIGLQQKLEIEAFDGPQAGPYLEAMRSGIIPEIRIPENADEASLGPSARAWLTGQIQASESYETDQRLKPWNGVGNDLGFRSSVAIPIIDSAGQTVALLNLYSRWPGFFSAHGRETFLDFVRQTLSMAVQRHSQGQVIPYQERSLYRRLIQGRQVQMHYQPIVDLRTGQVAKVEALARLLDDSGRIISPGAFLPALGNGDLLRVFEIAVEQSCVAHRQWRQEGLLVPVSVNLPPEGIGDARYHDALFGTIERCGADPSAIEIEILESKEIVDSDARDRFFEFLRLAGIRIIQDDLGSGHSSLLRMDSIPFDGVKIDQGLVLRASLKSPKRALEFIQHLVGLAHAFKIQVTVEGLEHPGLIEAAAILGADYGQGYGFARPMPAEQLVSWYHAFGYGVDRGRPQTPLGAMAGYLLWNRQFDALKRWPDMMEEFVRAPCPVQRFVEARSDQDAVVLEELLRKHHAVALQGTSGSLYRRTQEELIEALSALSLAFHKK